MARPTDGKKCISQESQLNSKGIKNKINKLKKRQKKVCRFSIKL